MVSLIGMVAGMIVPFVSSPHYVRPLIVLCGVIAVLAFIAQLLFQRREDAKRVSQQEARERQRDQRYEELFALVAPKHKVTDDDKDKLQPRSLCERIEAIAKELFAFLREKGMEPSIPAVEPGLSFEEDLKRKWPSVSLWIDAIYYGYERRFKQRLQDLLAELRERNIDSGITDSDIQPQQGQTADSIRTLAEKLLLLAAKMELSRPPCELSPIFLP